MRWAVVEAVARYHGGAPIAPTYRRIAERRGGKIGHKIAKVAAAKNCSPWSSTGCGTAKSAAWAWRPLEQARTQPARGP